MIEVTVSELAKTLGASVEGLLAQMKEAGLRHTRANQSIVDSDKQVLLVYLRDLHGATAKPPVRRHLWLKIYKLRESYHRSQSLIDELIPLIYSQIFGSSRQNRFNFNKVTMGDIIKNATQGKRLLRHQMISEEESENWKSRNDGNLIEVFNPRSLEHRPGRFRKMYSRRFTEQTNTDYDERIVKRGDFVMRRKGGINSVGKTFIIQESGPMIIPDDFFHIKFEQTVEPQYLSAFINTKHVQDLLFKNSKGPVTFSSINLSDVRSLEILVPPIDLQKKYINITGRLRELKFKSLNSEQTLSELRHAM